jgi:hypothetical protein
VTENDTIIKNLLELQALVPNDIPVGPGHYWLHTKQGPIDVLLDDLLKGE